MRFPFTRDPVLPPGAKVWRCDVDAFLAQQPPRPQLVIDIAGVEHAARTPPAVEVARYLERRRHPNPIVRYAAIRRLFRAAFPFRWSYLRPGRDPVAQLMRRNVEVRGRAVVALLAAASGGELPVELLNAPTPFGALLFDAPLPVDFERESAGGVL